MSILDKLLKPFRKSGNKWFYAVCHKDGHGSVEASCIVHAFLSEDARSFWINNINRINRERTGDLLDIAFAVPENDVNVLNAKSDVEKNPLVYNNSDFINSRIYIEHYTND